jgi:hypothetical protein
MFNREACERRVYRLATLLTGNPVAATKVISQVIDAQPDLIALDSAHMDRLTVLRAREIEQGVLVHDQVPLAVAKSLAKLHVQQREAWVLSCVYRTPLREVAKAMDCSVTATQRHLEQATHAMIASLGEQAGTAPQSLLEYSMSLDVPRFYRLQRRRQRNFKVAMIALAFAALAMLIAAAFMIWSRPLEGQ